MDKSTMLEEDTFRKLSKLMPNENNVRKLCRKIAFSRFPIKRESGIRNSSMKCTCGKMFNEDGELKRHISRTHASEISLTSNDIEDLFFKQWRTNNSQMQDDKADIPEKCCNLKCSCSKIYKVILYYCYTVIPSPTREISWQERICNKLEFKGKIRVANEGINGTLEGCKCAIDVYVMAMMERFPLMTNEDFKASVGNGKAFQDLKVSEYEELCSLGISPDDLKAADGGKHVTPEEFHEEIEKADDNTVVLDCRNFYESKIGYFEKAIKPNLRKFSYFPDYVDKNPDVFKDKKVLMYCTGGIRCERASAYIKKSGLSKEVLQLHGGIHKYLERYPNGHYKGKLFVFDNRYSIGGETRPPVSRCKYCDSPHDQYQLCSSTSCRQLVLSCDSCRANGKTTCCRECQENGAQDILKEECECTRNRTQIPVEKLTDGVVVNVSLSN